ncbi:phosphonate C-P lyase system protein PhnL [Paenibacillus periandrae]|uniref:phosphonate C-P lyase system protein PhnL n=1 Tax=Paenibacillus periandrae TaxID=1761741 RepID=UPI001F08E8B3|nr:phosphonate C-P lyase system protein PhnL [Paenibacillus periandrae]
MLQVQALSKTFHLALNETMEVSPLRNLSFSVPSGQFLGIAGPSGIGKSSILKCIYRTYLPSAGHIWFQSQTFGDIDLASADERQISRLRKLEIRYVSQFLRVIPRVEAIDIVAERLLLNGTDAGEARRQAGEMLDMLRVPRSLWKAYPATFSGGEQQRVNLARALVVPSRLLILDEPTASLDGESKKNVVALLEDMKRKGTTMIGVFHDVDIMEQLADTILDLGTMCQTNR